MCSMLWVSVLLLLLLPPPFDRISQLGVTLVRRRSTLSEGVDVVFGLPRAAKKLRCGCDQIRSRRRRLARQQQVVLPPPRRQADGVWRGSCRAFHSSV